MIRPPTTFLIAAIACGLLCCANNTHAADHSSYCSGMLYCLQERPKGCSAEDCTDNKIATTDSYCEIFKDLHSRGLRSTSLLGRQIYQQVSGKHRVKYVQEGTLPMPAEVMVYLMNNLPFAAHLVNAYQDTNFEAVYLDKNKKRFSGSGEQLSGTFTTVLQNESQTSSLYHGSGTADVLGLSLRGSALFLFDFKETGTHEITYNARCFVFPRSAFIRSILNFILFRRSIIGEIESTFGYIEDSAMTFHRGDREPIENYPAFSTPEGQQQIMEFQLLLQRTMGEAEAAPALPTEDTPKQTTQEPAGELP
jgi:hypothetical protein